MPRIFDDYSDLTGDVTKDAANRALRHFIYRTKRGMTIPAELQAFILTGLERQLADGTGGWFVPTRGRPMINNDAGWRFVAMIAWHEYYFIAKGHSEIRRKNASDFLIRQFGHTYCGFDLSDSGVRRMVRHINEQGFSGIDSSAPNGINSSGIDFLNAKLFCRTELNMRGLAELSHAVAMVRRLNKNRGHK